MKATETLIYTNTATNQSVSISFLSNLIPTAFDEDVDASFYTDKNSGQDGETLQNLDLEPREITIKAVFQADSNYRLFEKHIKSVFNPKTEGLLKYSDGSYIKSISCYPKSIPTFSYTNGKGSLETELICYGTYWKEQTVTDNLASMKPSFVFPQHFTPYTLFGVKAAQLVTKINNTGDADSGWTVRFCASFGSVKNPYIINRKTGEGVYFTAEMSKGDELLIDFTKQQPVIYKNGSKDFSVLNAPKSSFFKFFVGENEIEYGAEENVTNLEVYFNYNPLVL